jgi:hypothetical protein
MGYACMLPASNVNNEARAERWRFLGARVSSGDVIVRQGKQPSVPGFFALCREVKKEVLGVAGVGFRQPVSYGVLVARVI